LSYRPVLGFKETSAGLLLREPRHRSRALRRLNHLVISRIWPAPMVLPPSRRAKRWPFSIATGFWSSIEMVTLSPGITISTPSGRITVPVTSQVPKKN